MQKVLRRTALAKAQAKRKTRILNDKLSERDAYRYRQESGSILAQEHAAVRESRKQLREDWEMGSLAPWREYSEEAALKHGAWTHRMMTPPNVPERVRVKEKDCFFKVGDRVCVVEGREGVKGRIGRIERIEWEPQVVRIKGVNMMTIRVPSALRRPGSRPIQTTEGPIPLTSLKLVYPLPDPLTGIPRDCLLSNLVRRNPRFDIYANAPTFDRVLMPQNLRIPWPLADTPPETDSPADTLRIDVEEKTFLPTLLRPPMPGSVIDECRNAYSRFRDRHDEAWVAAKKAQDEAEAVQKARGERLRPKGARNVARQGKSSAGARFMEVGKVRADVENRNLEAVGAYMAARRGVGSGQGGKEGLSETVAQGLAPPPVPEAASAQAESVGPS